MFGFYWCAERGQQEPLQNTTGDGTSLRETLPAKSALYPTGSHGAFPARSEHAMAAPGRLRRYKGMTLLTSVSIIIYAASLVGTTYNHVTDLWYKGCLPYD
ncbi:Hypothetical protein Deide_1p00917 (plasmid) [Deinococcus deserti VCD115]|uniref:Uncharacterized protein n=1 Tax=Deinococcus deserti (strain DSM 17065 / CIP 109153 / LMG 22923 / VCD115) TaxID=546414 RepID=C1D265_DEIDV|nr:Hypothetical protein Deide_1p00917 [Deinococcus deserti VCD115]